MSDTITLYEKCIHDRLEAHGKGWKYEDHNHLGMRCKKPSRTAAEGYHWSDGCPGGRERTFRKPVEDEEDEYIGYMMDELWVEVSDVER